MTDRGEALREMSRLGQEVGPAVCPVCVTHMRFVPCRRDGGCEVSEDPSDVAAVAAWQMGASGQA